MKNSFFRISSFIITLMTAGSAVFAQDEVEFGIKGIKDKTVSEAISKSGTALLHAFNVGQVSNSELSLSGVKVNAYAKDKIMRSWDAVHFRCTDTDVFLDAKQRNDTLIEVRNIPLTMKATEKSSEYWKTYQEAVVSFKPDGTISDFKFALDPLAYATIMGESAELQEVEQRQIICDWLARFRNAYTLKDLEFMKNIYSDDALIISGVVIKRGKELPPVVKESTFTKAAYIEHLERIFKKNKKIEVNFNVLNITSHATEEGLYGVQLYQGYKSDNYHDEGYLFMLWDFRDQNNPQIHIRVWQQDEIFKRPDNTVKKYSMEDVDLSKF